MNFLKKYTVPLSIAGIWLSIFIIFYISLYILGISLEEFIFLIYDYIKNNMLIGAILFLIIFVIRPLVFIPVTPFEIFVGATFGIFWGMILCVLAYGLSAIFSYSVGRFTGGVFLGKLTQFEQIQKLRGKIETNTFSTIVTMRLLFFPVDFTNYLCGVFKIPRLSHVLGVMIGGFPGAFVFVLAGASVYGQEITSLSEVTKSVNYNYLFVASGLFILSVISSKFLKKKYDF